MPCGQVAEPSRGEAVGGEPVLGVGAVLFYADTPAVLPGLHRCHDDGVLRVVRIRGDREAQRRRGVREPPSSREPGLVEAGHRDVPGDPRRGAPVELADGARVVRQCAAGRGASHKSERVTGGGASRILSV